MVLVTGGTGLVGSHLLYLLLKDGERVRAIHRKNSNLMAVKRIFNLYGPDATILFNKIEWMEANITEIPILTDAFKDVTHVYHCAGYVNFNPAEYPVLKKINMEGTANIVNLCLSNQIEKLCYVSSVSTLGKKPNNALIDEASPWNPDEKNSAYAITKYGAEMEVWRGTQEGLHAVIVNPGIILGTSPNKDGSGIAVSLGSSGIPFYPTGGMGIVDVRDLVRSMVLLMESDIKNQQHIVVGENISYKDLLTQMAMLFGKKPPKIKVSKSWMFFLSGIDWLGSKILRTKRRITSDMVRAMFSTSHFDSTKIQKELHFKFTPTQETLKRMATSMQENQSPI